MVSTDLKPCPFCGGRAMIFEMTIEPDKETIELGCTICDARIKACAHQMMLERKNIFGFMERVPSGIWPEMGAIEQWNRRASGENA